MTPGVFLLFQRSCDAATMSDHTQLIIFDTTLRDGEPSPGASMNRAEKLEIAHALCELGVDVISNT